MASPLAPGLAAAAEVPGSSLGELFLAFLKIGSVLYGSGYVLVSFMEAEFVDSRGWLTEQQLLDAVSAGQFTPGPLFSTATFTGYVLDGVPGALVATAGIFLPSFVFVAVTHPLVPRLRSWRWTAPFLDGVNAAAIALMAVVTVHLARDALDGAFQFAVLGVAAVVLLRFNPNTVWLVLGGGAAGLIYEALAG
jgi:chromate transporter